MYIPNIDSLISIVWLYNHHQQSVSQLWCLYKQIQHVNIEYYHINKQLKQTWISAEIRCPMPDQKPMWTRCLGGFSVMWVTKLLISPVKTGFFAQKRPNLAQNWHFCPLLTHLVPCWWVGWWLWRGLYLARHLQGDQKRLWVDLLVKARGDRVIKRDCDELFFSDGPKNYKKWCNQVIFGKLIPDHFDILMI